MKNITPLLLIGTFLSSANLQAQTPKTSQEIIPPSSFMTIGALVGGNASEMDRTIASSAGSVNSFGRFGYQISSLGGSYVEKWPNGTNSYVENVMAFSGGFNYRYNKYLYPYLEAGLGRTTTDGTRESGSHRYFVSEIGVMARPFKYLNVSAGYLWSNTPNEVTSLNGFSIKAGIFF